MCSVGKRLLSLVLSLMMIIGVMIVGIGEVSTSALTPSYTPSSSYKSSSYYTRLCAVNLTGNQRNDIAAVALSQEGYYESNSANKLGGANLGSGTYKNYTEYGYWFGKQTAWCAIFISWCAAQAGVSTSVVKKNATATAQAFCGTYYSFGDVVPQVGDIIALSTSNQHVGLIYKTDSNFIYTIEGNMRDGGTRVSKVQYSRSTGKRTWNNGKSYDSEGIVRIACPKYSSQTISLPAPVNNINGLKSTYSVGETLSISWPAASGATGYEIYISDGWGVYDSIGNTTSYSYVLGTPGYNEYVYIVSKNSVGSIEGSKHYFNIVCSSHVKGDLDHISAVHPHNNYYKCSKCGEIFCSDETNYDDNCLTCNPLKTITYNANGGIGAPDNQSGRGNITLSSTMPTKNGYHFLGWSINSNATYADYYTGSTYNLTQDTVLYAVWDLIDKSGPIINVTDTSYSGIVSKQIYAFNVDFLLEDESSITSVRYYSYSTANGDDDAKWYSAQVYSFNGEKQSWCTVNLSDHNNETGNYYLLIKVQDEWGNETSKGMYVEVPENDQIRYINYNTNGGSWSEEYSWDMEFNSKYKWGFNLRNTVPSRRGYIFLGWATDQYAKVAMYQPGEEVRPTSDLYLYAVWLNNENPAKGDVNCNGELDLKDTIEILKEANGSGSLTSFERSLADLNNDGIVDSNDSNIILRLVAQNQYVLNFNSNGGDFTPQGQIGNGRIKITQNCPVKNGYTFLGWSKLPNATSSEYKPGEDFDLDSNTVLYAIWKQEEVGKIIYYGSYPQSLVTDTSLIDELNSQPVTWHSYNYYSGTVGYTEGLSFDERIAQSNLEYNGEMTPGNYMRYADLSYNGNKYRAVVFDTYRPTTTGSMSVNYPYYDNSYVTTRQYENGYCINSIYWFVYEPLKWILMDPASGMVVCDTIIDSQPFNNFIIGIEQSDGNGTLYYGDSARTHYSSNYAYSSLRQWLNDDFYNTAFSSSEKSHIVDSEIKTVSTNYKQYDSESTTDKIFLLSYDEASAETLGMNNSARKRLASDYAYCQGFPSWGGCYSLRTPHVSFGVLNIHINGSFYNYNFTDGTYGGICPAMRISNYDFTLSYDSYGGTGAPSKQSGNGIIKLSSVKPTRNGCSFLGWTDSPELMYTSEFIYNQPGDYYNLTTDTTLYAVWESYMCEYCHSNFATDGELDEHMLVCTKKPVTVYTLVFSANGGNGAPANQTGNGNITLSSIRPTRSGYTFQGWATSSSATSAQYLPGSSFNLNGNKTLYAIWKVNSTANAKINVAGTTTLSYRTIVTIKATATNLDPAYHLVLEINGKETEGNDKEVVYEYGEIKNDVNYSVKIVDANGNVQKDENRNDLMKDGGTIKCNAGFFQKLIAFFQGLFKSLPKKTVQP